ncbi:sequence-specific DNA binding RNA polymerase II transcription factor [Ascochyta rabiei]|uniref:Sequence-specific DNA binding RNA polymerase II transcription factor n=2 Tax=Didymella rabiei TaxID=5454 RepID=A0A162ZCX7_DIDRA|nr:sequence-specific DNA binding RNA polymerase II transcription factor [Ascochyta rabiei]
MEAKEGRSSNAFACERCRKHKVRCVPSDKASVCQRCQKARVECIEHVARRRPAKPRIDGQTPNKMRDFDKKLDKISAIVATMAPVSVLQPALPSATTVPSQFSDTAQRTSPPAPAPALLVKASPSATKEPGLPAPVATPEDSLAFWGSINDTLSCLGKLDPVIRSISFIHMQMLVDVYRTMADYFPFVTLPKDCTCRDLFQQRPILMFAVLVVASYDSVLLQLTLSREFRKVATVKVMNGEKSLDLLQGLLVFIAWHHHYMDAQAVSIPMLLQICAGIAGDLELDSLSTAVRSPLHKNDPRDKEAKRAYLGCYYLASNINLTEPGKARCMSYSSTIRTYASELASSWEHKSDAILPIVIDICQFTEDVQETFAGPTEQALIARTQVKRLIAKWDSICLASKLQASDFKTLQWMQLAAHTYLYKTAASIDLSDCDSTPWASGFQLSLRVTCLRSIEQFLDNSTKLQSSQYEVLCLIDWLNLVSTMTSLSKLALQSSPMPGWDTNELQVARSFEYFRDQLVSQMPRPRDPQETSEDIFERFRRITAVMKMALTSSSGGTSPGGSTFQLATGSGRTVSLLQDLPLPEMNGINGDDSLHVPWKLKPTFDLNSHQFPWRFLSGTV